MTAEQHRKRTTALKGHVTRAHQRYLEAKGPEAVAHWGLKWAEAETKYWKHKRSWQG